MQSCLPLFSRRAKESYNPGLAVLTWLERQRKHVRRFNLQERLGWRIRTRSGSKQRLRHANGKPAGSRGIVATMSANCIPEFHGPFLIGAIVCAPMIIHDPRVELLRGLNVLAPNVRIALRSEHRRSDAADFNKRGVKRHPGYALALIRYIDPTPNRQPVLARSWYLVRLRAHGR